MSRAELLQKITTILSEVVDDPDLVLTENMTADDVADWDSVNHVKLIIALESELHIRFEPEEITSPEDVGALVDLLERKLAAK